MSRINKMSRSEALNALVKVAKLQAKLLKKLAAHSSDEMTHEDELKMESFKLALPEDKREDKELREAVMGLAGSLKYLQEKDADLSKIDKFLAEGKGLYGDTNLLGMGSYMLNEQTGMLVNKVVQFNKKYDLALKDLNDVKKFLEANKELLHYTEKQKAQFIHSEEIEPSHEKMFKHLYSK